MQQKKALQQQMSQQPTGSSPIDESRNNSNQATTPPSKEQQVSSGAQPQPSVTQEPSQPRVQYQWHSLAKNTNGATQCCSIKNAKSGANKRFQRPNSAQRTNFNQINTTQQTIVPPAVNSNNAQNRQSNSNLLGRSCSFMIQPPHLAKQSSLNQSLNNTKNINNTNNSTAQKAPGFQRQNTPSIQVDLPIQQQSAYMQLSDIDESGEDLFNQKSPTKKFFPEAIVAKQKYQKMPANATKQQQPSKQTPFRQYVSVKKMITLSPEEQSSPTSEHSSTIQIAAGSGSKTVNALPFIVQYSNVKNAGRRASESYIKLPTSSNMCTSEHAGSFKHNESDIVERDQTPKRDDANLAQGQTNFSQSKILSVSPYQKSGFPADNLSQKNMFTIPKTRTITSTTPADRIQGMSMGQVAQNFPTILDQVHELNPIREGRQTEFQHVEEESIGNISQQINDITHQPASKAFSMTGLRHEESLQADQDHFMKPRIRQTSSMSKQSHSAAGDGLPAMQHDQTINPETDNNEDNASFVSSDQFVEIGGHSQDQGLRVVCDFPVSDRSHSKKESRQYLSVRGAYNDTSMIKKDDEEPLLLLQPPRRQDDVQTRIRLHSNFTSRFTKGTNFNNLVADDANTLRATQTIQTSKKSKHEPRIKRQAQSIVNWTRSGIMNMQPTSTVEWQENQFNSSLNQRIETEPAASICNTCHERKIQQATRYDQHEEMSLINHQRSVQLNRTVQTMRFDPTNELKRCHTLQSQIEDRRDLSDRMHYATSSYSSNRFCFKDSDQGSRSVQSKNQQNKITGKNSRLEQFNEQDPENLNEANESNLHGCKRQKMDKLPTISPSEMGQNSHHRRNQANEKDTRQHKDRGGRSSHMSYFSSTKFPIAAHNQRQESSRKRHNFDHSRFDKNQAHPRSRSRLRSRSYSRSRSRSRSNSHKFGRCAGNSSMRGKGNYHGVTRQLNYIITTDNHEREDRQRESKPKGMGHHQHNSRSSQRHQRPKDNYIRHYDCQSNQSRRSRRHGDARNNSNGSRSNQVRNQTRDRSATRRNTINYGPSQRRDDRAFFDYYHSSSKLARTTTMVKSNHHRDYHPYSTRYAAADEGQYRDTENAFYQKREPHNQKQHNYWHQKSFNRRQTQNRRDSRGRRSFKTQKERVYNRDRRSRSRGLSSFSSRGGHSLNSSYSRGPPISSVNKSKKFPSQHNSSNSPPATGVGIDRSKDAGHFEWRKNMLLKSCNPQPGTQTSQGSQSRYQVVDHLGDGTFGRALKVLEIPTHIKDQDLPLLDVSQQAQLQTYAIKVVRAVSRYAESAKFEAQILQGLQEKGGSDRGIVHLKETFINNSKQSYGNVSNLCLVFEPLGKSLYDFIKDNGYKGFEIGQIREIALQALQAIEFLHSIKLSHTDLKPENILLKNDSKEIITDEVNFPIQVQNKRNIFGSQKCSDYDDSSYSGQSQQVRGRKWFKPNSSEIKVIDFGGATYEHEKHTLIINTRQYRAPEVILENPTWDEKSDIWSMACILVELYTGEVFFDTDENIEHMAMIEKQSGPVPLHMAQRCGNDQIKRQLHRQGSREEEQYVKNKKMRLRWPAASLRASSRTAVNNMLMLDDIVSDKWGEQHRLFKDLIKFMLKIDPKERPSARDCLSHNFFYDIRKLSKSTEKTQVSTADHQFESPRLRHV